MIQSDFQIFIDAHYSYAKQVHMYIVDWDKYRSFIARVRVGVLIDWDLDG